MEFEPKLRAHKVVPLWTLPDKYGEPFNLAKQRGREHMLLLVSAVDPTPLTDQLAPLAPELRTLPARILIVVADEETAGALPGTAFTVLIDADGKVRNQYLPDGAQAGLFLLDRYGDLYRQWLVDQAAALPPASEIRDWMEAISMQCSV